MNKFRKIYCRIFQTGFKLALPVLPYRKPKRLKDVKEISQVLKRKNIRSVLLVTDAGVLGLGLTKRLEKNLAENGINCVIYDGTVANPTTKNVEEALNLYYLNDCEALIGFGGGSSMDCAKAVGARVAKPGQSLNQMKGILKVHKKLPPLIAVPSTSGTGSEATLASVIVDSETRHKYAINDFPLIPRYAVLDPRVTLSLPPYITATTGMDALTHAMKESDITNVEAALTKYDTLSDEQKSYVETARIEAVRSNLNKIKNGLDPDIYPEYADGDEKTPVYDRIEIQVVDKYGAVVPNFEFNRKRAYFYQGEEIAVVDKKSTDSNGKLTFQHTSYDASFEIITVYPPEGYVCSPSEITYASDYDRKTVMVNGQEATGLEELKFVLIPESEYVEKSELSEVLNNAKEVEAEYKYTDATYQTYKNALIAAQTVFDDPDATSEQVTEKTQSLDMALKGLQKSSVLKALKLNVYDKNGNPFTRIFKVQMCDMNNTKYAWNPEGWTDGLIPASAGWIDGHTYRIWACQHEPYDIKESDGRFIYVKIGKTAEGETYYSEVNGQKVGVDFEKKIVVIPRPDGAPDPANERKPDPAVLNMYIDQAKGYSVKDYTPNSYEKLEEVVTKSEEVAETVGATQEDYNQVVADLKEAMDGLKKRANKLELKSVIEKSDYYEDYYTKESYEMLKAQVQSATEIYNDENVTQEAVDTQTANLRLAITSLVKVSDEQKVFRVKVVNEKQESLSNVCFKVVCGENVTTIYSDALGMLAYRIRPEDVGKEVSIVLNTSQYITTDAYVLKIDEKEEKFVAVNNRVFETGMKFSFVLTENKTIKSTSIVLTGAPSKKIGVGKGFSLKANVFPRNATNKNVVWTSSNSKYATVNAYGYIKTKKAGRGKSVTITARSKDGGALARFTFKIMKGYVKSVKISGKSSVKAGKTLKLKAKVNATKGANKKVIWTSSNPKIAVVSSTGKVKTFKGVKGKVKITAKAVDGSNKSKSKTIKVK